MGSTPVLKCESGSSRFQPGEGPSRGLLRDYEPSDAIRMELFEALVCMLAMSAGKGARS